MPTKRPISSDKPSRATGFPNAGEIIIAPSILSADFAHLARDVGRSWRAGCSWVHLDVMDYQFVPNLTFGAPVVAALRKACTKPFFDAHLMVQEPQKMVAEFAKAGTQNLTFHVEATGDHTRACIREIRRHNMTVGISIKPKTPIDAIADYLSMVDLVLVMTVEPGFGGQELLPPCLVKVRKLAKLREKHNYRFALQVDGGIHVGTAGLAAASGAEILVAGSAVFQGNDIAANIGRLAEKLKRAS